MVEDKETPNTASWYVNGSFLSAWYSTVDGADLPESAAAFVEMSQDPAFGAVDSGDGENPDPHSSQNVPAGGSGSASASGAGNDSSNHTNGAPAQGMTPSGGAAPMAPMG